MPSSPAPARPFTPAAIWAGRAGSLSSGIIAGIREALFSRQLKPGDFIGTENELAARHGVSRIVARDALRTLQALGIAEIKMGKGGGARIARGNISLFAEALAVQLELTGVTAAEIVDAQRGIECVAAELAAGHATAAELANLDTLLAHAANNIRDVAAFTRAGRDFHLAIARASHNRVLVVQLISLQHVPWPKDNRTLTAKVAVHILEVHRKLAALLQARDGAAARALMDDHVKMIRSRRSAERDAAPATLTGCC